MTTRLAPLHNQYARLFYAALLMSCAFAQATSAHRLYYKESEIQFEEPIREPPPRITGVLWSTTSKEAVLLVDGEIQSGDYEGILSGLRSAAADDATPTHVELRSNGGNVIEAMRIGRLLRYLMLDTYVPIGAPCHSACFLMLAAGATRSTTNLPIDECKRAVTGRIIFGGLSESIGRRQIERFCPDAGRSISVHRPSFAGSRFGKLSGKDAETQYNAASTAVKDYLLEMGVSDRLIRKLFSTSSSEVAYVTGDEIQNEIAEPHPFLKEWLLAKCGELPKDEEVDLFGARAAQNLPRTGVAVSQEFRQRYSDGYVRYLEDKMASIEECKRKAVADERKRRLDEVLAR